MLGTASWLAAVTKARRVGRKRGVFLISKENNKCSLKENSGTVNIGSSISDAQLLLVTVTNQRSNNILHFNSTSKHVTNYQGLIRGSFFH